MNQDLIKIQNKTNNITRETIQSCKETLKMFVEDYPGDEYDIVDFVLSFESVYRLNLSKYEQKASGAALRDLIELKRLKEFMIEMIKELYSEEEVNRRTSIR